MVSIMETALSPRTRRSTYCLSQTARKGAAIPAHAAVNPSQRERWLPIPRDPRGSGGASQRLKRSAFLAGKSPQTRRCTPTPPTGATSAPSTIAQPKRRALTPEATACTNANQGLNPAHTGTPSCRQLLRPTGRHQAAFDTRRETPPKIPFGAPRPGPEGQK